MTGRKCRRCRVVRTSPAASPITALEGSTGALQEAEAHHPLRPPLGALAAHAWITRSASGKDTPEFRALNLPCVY